MKSIRNFGTQGGQLAQKSQPPFVKQRNLPAVDVEEKKSERLKLSFFQCPGDTLVATAAIECLMNTYPGRYVLDVEGTDAYDIFEHNPRITFGSAGRQIQMDNRIISESDRRPVHFMETYTHWLEQKLGIALPLTVNRPYVYLSDEEKGWIPQVEEVTGKRQRYWVVNSGTKLDYTIKHWGHHNYQKVVDILAGEVLFVQVGRPEHKHDPLEGAIDLRGKTTTRQLIRLCYHATGGLGGESFNHHLFAALQKPFVCLLSGFLPRNWVQYPTTTCLHKSPQFPCFNKALGCCWKSRSVPQPGNDHKNLSVCQLPVLEPEPVAGCLAAITPEEVVTYIRGYDKHAV